MINKVKYKNTYIHISLILLRLGYAGYAVPHYFLAFASLITQTVIIHLPFVSFVFFCLLARNQPIWINIVVRSLVEE
jgi:hypothetical protein